MTAAVGVQRGTYSTADLIELAGLTPRRANHWHDIGLLVPVVAGIGSGSHRRYDEREIRVARVVRVLADLGCPLRTCERVARQLRGGVLLDVPFVFVTADGEVVDPWDRDDEPGVPASGWVVNLDELALAS